MFDPTNLGGAAITASLCGVPLRTPFILSSGPLGYGAEGLIRAHEAGCGAVVTKTIRLGRAINPARHISPFGTSSLLNCEKWSDADRHEWYEDGIPRAKAAGAVVIASVGHTEPEARAIVRDVEAAGADMIELVSYTEETLLPMLECAKALVHIPVICKLSANWPDPAQTGLACLARGADGLCAVDSIGPALRIDVERARPVLSGAGGRGWMTGDALRPLSLHVNAAIAAARPDFTGLYGSGGCMSAHDAMEFLLAGCACVGVCTAPMLKGLSHITRMCSDLSLLLARLGYETVAAARGAALANLPEADAVRRLDFSYEPAPDAAAGTRGCTQCRRCETVCCYGARTLDYPAMRFEREKCRDCGLCAAVCPTGALRASLAPQTAQDREREREAASFDSMLAAGRTEDGHA